MSGSGKFTTFMSIFFHARCARMCERGDLPVPTDNLLASANSLEK